MSTTALRVSPNKPMVPTATNQIVEYSAARSQRHIGQPFGNSKPRARASAHASRIGVGSGSSAWP